MRDIDILGDHRACRHVGARQQFVGTGAQDRLHRLVEPLERPAAGEPRGDRRVDLGAARVRALHDIVEEAGIGLGIFGVLDRRAEPVLMEFMEQRGNPGALHLMLVERLDGGEARGGAGFRSGGGARHETRRLGVRQPYVSPSRAWRTMAANAPLAVIAVASEKEGMTFEGLLFAGAIFGLTVGLAFRSPKLGCAVLFLVPVATFAYFDWWQARLVNPRSTTGLDFVFVTLPSSSVGAILGYLVGMAIRHGRSDPNNGS